jgi:drug/metabolite transporter (DMT)-like permease
MESSPLLTTIYGLLAAIAWGASDFLAAKASRRKNPEAVALFASTIGALGYLLIYIVNSGNEKWNLTGLLYAAVAGISIEIGLLLFYKGLVAGPVSIVSPVGSAYPLITTLIVIVFFGGVLRFMDILGIIIVVGGIVIASRMLPFKKSQNLVTRGVLYGFLTFIFWGLGYAMLGQAVSKIGWQKATLIDIFSGLIALLVIIIFTLDQKLRKNMAFANFTDKYILTVAIIQLLGGVIFSYGLAHARSIAVITTISASYPALTILLALKYFGEKKSLVPLIGAFITVGGIIVLSI